MTNHPVHIVNEAGQLSPSAFIPFCSFGEEMNAMGIQIDNFNVPVCNSFKAIIHNDQLCYQIDLEKYKKAEMLNKQLKHGLVIILDENKDRQFLKEDRKMSGGRNLFSPEEENSIQIHLDTISKLKFLLPCQKATILIEDSVTLSGEGEYNLNILNQIEVTESFLGLPEEVRSCQNVESYINCTTRHLLQNMREKCGCLPLALTKDQV